MQPTSRASSTALLIAASLVLQDERGSAAGRIPAASVTLGRQALRAAGWPWRQIGGGLRFGLVRAAFACLEHWTLPGIQTHYLLRKQRIAGWADQALASGCRQILVLGAGFDGLAADLARRDPALRVVEWDHPATQKLKREALGRTGTDAANLQLLAVDIANDDAMMALANSGLDRDAPTLIVAEGLLMYLPRERCEQLLDLALRWFAGPLRIACSYMEHDARGEPGFANARASVSRWLRRRGEPFLWACNDAALAARLAERRWRLLESDDGTIAPAPALRGWIACAGETVCLVEAIR